MRILFAFLSLISFSSLISQSNTEVYLFDLSKIENTFELANPRNISNNEGYDNQPSFYNDNIVLFSSTRNDQTDIVAYNIRDKKTDWITNTPNGSEYSPTKIPGKKKVSSIRLDKDGKQLLYSYDYEKENVTTLIENLKIGYHTWFNKNTIISSIIDEGGLSLVVSDLSKKTNDTVQKNVGRSLHKIPNSNLISYISKATEKWEIRSFDPTTGVSKIIIETIPEAEDMCWLADGTILMPKGNMIFKFNPENDKNWSIFRTFIDPEIANITRIASNQISTMLTLVSEVSPEHIVQKQLDAYNARDIDAFLATYSRDIKIYDFPNKLSFEGQEKMRQTYEPFFARTPDLHCEIKKRIVVGNKVIDEESVTMNGQKIKAVAIYEVTNGKISKVTFVR